MLCRYPIVRCWSVTMAFVVLSIAMHVSDVEVQDIHIYPTAPSMSLDNACSLFNKP